MGVDRRGFHMKKNTWKCINCVNVITKESEVINPGNSLTNNFDSRARKCSRDEDNEQNFYADIMQTLKIIIEANKEISLKLTTLIDENKDLKAEIAELKFAKYAQDMTNMPPTYSNVAKKTIQKSNVLILKPKNTLNSVSKTKEDLIKNVQPS